MDEIIKHYSDVVIAVLGIIAVSALAGLCFEEYREVVTGFLDKIIYIRG